MTKVKQSKGELLGHLQDQINFLINSAESYDKGSIGEAKRLAVVVRVLLHDTSQSTSLLTQLGKKNIGFYDSSIDYDPKNLAPHIGLLVIKLTPGSVAEYVAPLDNLPPSRIKGKISFDEWWDKIVLKDSVDNIYSRGYLIQILANKEGGAHVDPKLEADYVNLSKYNSLGWKSVSRRGDVITEADMGNPVLVSMRQIGYEVIKTLKDEFPELYPA